MPSEHHRISPRYWSGVRRGWNDREKLLGIYLMTCRHRNTEGLFHLPKGYIAIDLGWTLKQVDDALATVIAGGVALYDEAAEVMLLPQALKRQRPTTTKQLQGAVRCLVQVPETTLWPAFIEACNEYAPKLAELLISQSADRALQALTDGHSNGHDDGHSNAHSDGRGNGHSNGSADSSRAHDRAAPTPTPVPTPYPPSPPVGGRQRDREDFEQKMATWTRQHFPGAEMGAVLTVIGQIRGRRREPTAEAIRDFARANPAYLGQLGLDQNGAAA